MKFVAFAGLAALAFADVPVWKEEFMSMKNLDVYSIFKSWQQDFERVYTNDDDEAAHFLTFYDNLYNIVRSNQANTYKLRLNQFGDLSGDEFRLQVHGHTGSCMNLNQRPSEMESVVRLNPLDLGVDVPSSVDWRKQGVVTPVKNQGQCGSCWSFSTTGSIECTTAIKTGKLVSLSEQQLVDCSGSYGNQGCNGGLMDDAFKYVKAEGGLCSETAYPYKAADGTCRASSCGTKYSPISGYTDVTKDSSSSLEAAVAQGCVSVAIQANQFAFQFYSSGVLSGNCGTSLDHGVLVVGYGEENGEDYWWVKNSWGATWGEEGYLQICRDCGKNGKKGECGILETPSYPIPQ